MLSHRIRTVSTLSIVLTFGACSVERVPIQRAGDSPSVDAAQGAMNDAQGNSDAAPSTDATPMGSEDSGQMSMDATPPMDVALPTVDATTTGDGARTTDGHTNDASGDAGAVADGGIQMADGDLDAGGGAGDGAMPMACVGPEPRMDEMPPEAIPEGTCMNCPGAPTPIWRLDDFQNDSCGFEQTYGLNSFNGRATLVALFNAGCGYCQGQAQNLERMRLELIAEGVSAHFSAMNGDIYEVHQARIVDRCSFPFFQDTAEAGAMASMGGRIYDMYVYRPDGTLHVFFDGFGELNTYLTEVSGYENVKAAMVSAARGEEYVAPHPPVEIFLPDGGLGNADQGNE